LTEVNFEQKKKKKKSKPEQSVKTVHPDVFDFINATCSSFTNEREETPQQEELIKSILCHPKNDLNILEVGDNESKLKGKMVNSVFPFFPMLSLLCRSNCKKAYNEILGKIW
jgi:hypothetical protein